MNETISFKENMTAADKVRKVVASVNKWLDTKSVFYSKMAEFECTRREVAKVHGATLCIVVAAMAAESNPLVALMAAVPCIWLTRGLNK